MGSRVSEQEVTQETDLSAFGTDVGISVILHEADRGVWVLRGFSWGYDADPTDGRVSITGGGLPAKSWPVTAGGPGFITFPSPLECNMTVDCQITIAPGGTGIRADLNVEAELR